MRYRLFLLAKSYQLKITKFTLKFKYDKYQNLIKLNNSITTGTEII